LSFGSESLFTKTQTQAKNEAFDLTECKTDGANKQGQMTLDLGLGKLIQSNFDGGLVSSDGGLLLLRKADDQLELSELAQYCFSDDRRQDLLQHPILGMLRQRIYSIAAGYEDCNDATKLRIDGMHKLAVGRKPSDKLGLASQPTLSRWENSADSVSLDALQKLLVRTYINQQKRKPKVIKLAVDTTCDRVHGYQQLSFYNGFYREYCFTPLFIFTEDGFPLAALLRAGNAGKYDGTVRMLRPIVEELRRTWPRVRIELTADAAFAAPDVYNFCEQNHVTYYIAIAGNHAIQIKAKAFVEQTKALFDELSSDEVELLSWRKKEEARRFRSKEEGRMQEAFEAEQVYIRKFTEFNYQAREWPHERRIICKVECTSQGTDTRYVVTNAKRNRPDNIYAKYCQRAQCENWIKDLKNYLHCDRTSCQEFNANQLRLLLHTFAYILLWKLRKQAKLKYATVETVRLHLLKIGVLVTESVRRICLKFSSTHPWQDEYRLAWNSS